MDIQWRKEWTAPSVVGAVTFVAGVGVGYGIRSYLNYRIVKDIRESVDEAEVLDLNLFNDILEEASVDEDLEMDFDAADEETEVETVSVFQAVEVEDNWDYAKEVEGRNAFSPYVIHKDEFDDNENDFIQSTLTYYEGDDILCDDKDIPIYNWAAIVGKLKFGHGSQDQNIVFVRNERLKADYEILHDSGMYAVEVLGEEIEASLSNDKTPLPKFRDD